MNNDIATPSTATDPVTAPPLQSTVLYFARLGDMVMLTALLEFLHRRFHQPCQVIGAGPWNAEMYLENPDVSQIWWFGRHFPFPLTFAWPRVARALRASHPGPIYICEHHYRQLPRIKRILSFAGVDPARCVFINEIPGTVHHSVDRLIRLGERTPPLLQAGDYPPPVQDTPWAPRLRVLNADRVDLESWLRGRNWTGRPIILVQPGNHRSMSRKRNRWRRLNTDNKYWPTDRWVALMHKVHARMPNALIMLRGTDEEVKMLQEIQAAAALDCVVVTSVYLRRLFALCEYAHSMISVDTGPAHAAAALGLPSVVMFGAEEQRFWLPRSPVGSPVIGVGGPPESIRADQISVDTVFAAWCRLLERMETSPRRAPAESAPFQPNVRASDFLKKTPA